VQSPTKHKVNVPDPNASPSIELIRFVGDWAKMMMLYLWMIRPSCLDFSPTVFFSLSRPWEFFVITKGAVCDASWVFFLQLAWLVDISIDAVWYDTTGTIDSLFGDAVVVCLFIYLSFSCFRRGAVEVCRCFERGIYYLPPLRVKLAFLPALQWFPSRQATLLNRAGNIFH